MTLLHPSTPLNTMKISSSSSPKALPAKAKRYSKRRTQSESSCVKFVSYPSTSADEQELQQQSDDLDFVLVFPQGPSSSRHFLRPKITTARVFAPRSPASPLSKPVAAAPSSSSASPTSTVTRRAPVAPVSPTESSCLETPSPVHLAIRPSVSFDEDEDLQCFASPQPDVLQGELPSLDSSLFMPLF